MLRPRKFLSPLFQNPGLLIVPTSFLLYVVLYNALQQPVGAGVSVLALLPIVAGSWFFGLPGGLLMSFLALFTNRILQAEFYGLPLANVTANPADLAFVVVAIVIGILRWVNRERGESLLKLKQLQKERQDYTHFLELLEKITRQALEAESLEPAFGKLLQSIAELFQADDCYLSYWDEARKVSLPVAAYGAMSDSYPGMKFEPGSRTPTALILEEGRPLAIPDLHGSDRIDPALLASFRNRSLLGLPLIVQNERFGALHLGYNQPRIFEQEEIDRAEMAAQQIALALSKVRLLEDARKQVKQLTALHDVALASTQASSVDELIERVTGIIGRNLFPDNFGILMRDEQQPVIRPHASYRFHPRQQRLPFNDIPLGTGITGLVALTDEVQRLNDTQASPSYISMDDYIHSELCVPIQLKENILGVINAESSQMNAFSADDERLLTILAGQLATAIEQLRIAETERGLLAQLAHSNELTAILTGMTTEMEKTSDQAQVLQTLGAEFAKLGITSILAYHLPQQKSFSIDYRLLSEGRLSTLADSIGFPLTVYSFPADQVQAVVDDRAFYQASILQDGRRSITALVSARFQDRVPGILRALEVDAHTQVFHLPLVFEERLLGVLWIWGPYLQREDLLVLSGFAKQVAITMENARLFQEVQSLALTDPLTGLHNRRNLFELGRLEFARSERMNRPMCCMLLDLDHFKSINDTYGHQAGDKVLQEFAHTCKRSVREIDLVGRYGGEELIILLPETSLESTQQIAERLRRAVEALQVSIDERPIQTTVSIGVARIDENTPNLETLIARADQAMYSAKHLGRNRVAVGR